MARETRYRGFFVFEHKGGTRLVFHASKDAPLLRTATSKDGKKFRLSSKSVEFLSDKKKNEGWRNTDAFRVTSCGKKLLLSFLKKDASSTRTIIASSSNGFSWKRIGGAPIARPTVVIGLEGKKKPFLAYSSTRNGPIALAVSLDLKTWEDWGPVILPRASSFDASSLTPLFGEETKRGILLVYTAADARGRITVGAALFDKDSPEKTLWKSPDPIWSVSAEDGKAIRFIGGIDRKKYFYAYAETPDGVETFPIAKYWETYAPSEKAIERKKKLAPKKKRIKEGPHRLKRHHANPILEPRAENTWESLATFNPAAIHLDGRVHLLYRAQGHDGLSVLGYASSLDGISIDERLEHPAFVPSRSFDSRKKGAKVPTYPYVSGGGWGGCEDPRLTRIGDTIYLIYIAFNGAHPPGVALSSIQAEDFLEKRWKWSESRLISRPGTIQKNWVIFPEKIGGKFAVLHNISPRILVEYLDSLDDDVTVESYPPRQGTDKTRWDNIMRGAGAPPIKTDRGWLVFYHAMDARDPNKYKVGAMLLDLDNPEKVLHRSHEPVLEPEEEYENNGLKWGVVYVCGAVVKDGTLFVYYGASDRTLAVASAPLSTFLDALTADKPSPLRKISEQ